jgi:hypothetical protein
MERVLATWERPASDTEEAKIERAATMVRDAVALSDWIVSQAVKVFPQGSYFNNTNVRLDADMDLRAVHPLIRMHYGPGVARDLADRALGIAYPGPTLENTVTILRDQLAEALVYTFGGNNVDATGEKAIRVKELPSSRAKVDVVPAFRLMYVDLNEAGQYRVPHIRWHSSSL